MTPLTIFSDRPPNDPATQWLVEAAAPHRIIFPKAPQTSVLAPSEPDPAFGEADIAFGQPDLESIRSAEHLRWIHISSAGFTRYDTPEFRALAEERGLLVSNSSAVYASACAEHVFAFLTAQSRGLPQALRSETPNGSEEWNRLREGSISLRGQQVVILGYGSIARELVPLLAPFRMHITAMRRTPRGDEGFPTITEEALPEALSQADHVINILPDNAAARGFFDAARFSAIKPGAVFYNIGRGTTVQQPDLLEALRSRHLRAAWLDVTDPEPLPSDHPLRREPNCHITPHIAGGHSQESRTLVNHFLENLCRYQEGRPLLDRIM